MTDANYAQLLEDLRRDLQLNPSTDLLPFAVASAQNLPWKVDLGVGTVTFAASPASNTPTVSHRLGRAPLFVCPVYNGAGELFWGTASYTTTSFTVTAATTGAITGTFTFNWVAIG